MALENDPLLFTINFIREENLRAEPLSVFNAWISYRPGRSPAVETYFDIEPLKIGWLLTIMKGELHRIRSVHLTK